MGDSKAKDILLNALTSGTRAYLEHHLEDLLEDDEDDSLPVMDCLELIPFLTYVRLLRRGPLLEAYPARPSKVDLRASRTCSISATSAGPTQMASVFHQNHLNSTTTSPAPTD